MHTLDEFKKLIEAKLLEADRLYGTKFTGNINISFKLRGQTAGYAGWKRIPGVRRSFGVPFSEYVQCATEFYLKFNPDAIKKHWDDMVESTIPHEIAHLVDAYLGYFSHHGREWQRFAIELGDKNNGNRCHSYEDLTPGRVTQKFAYKSTAGTEIIVGAKIHNKIQSGYRGYRCAKTHAPLIKESAVKIR